MAVDNKALKSIRQNTAPGNFWDKLILLFNGNRFALPADVARLIRRSRFSSPVKKDILVFDRNLLGPLNNALLEKYDYEVLYIRQAAQDYQHCVPETNNLDKPETFYIGLKILWLMLTSIPMLAKARGLVSFKILLFSCIKCLNKFACIKAVNPKIIISYNDHHGIYFILAALFPKIKFIIFQHGALGISLIRSFHNQNARLSHHVTNLTHYCFGSRDVDIYEQVGYNRKPFVVFGSLVMHSFMNRSGNCSNQPYDICVISDFRLHVSEPSYKCSNGVNFFENRAHHFSNIDRYVKERGLSLCVALRCNTRDEIDYFRKKLGNEVVLFKNNHSRFNSYKAVKYSKLIVGYSSTLLLEALSIKKLVFIYDPYERDQSIFWNNKDRLKLIYTRSKIYKDYKDKMDYLFSINPDDYRKIIENFVNLYMNNMCYSKAMLMLYQQINSILDS
jgi:surface carbohydrate biosynthesis protein